MRNNLFFNDRGLVSMTFVLSTGGLLLALMGAIDVMRWATVQGRLQDAMDAAVLAGGRNLSNLSTNPTPDQLAAWKVDAMGYFTANLPTDYMGSILDPKDVQIDVSYAPASANAPSHQTISMHATGKLPLLVSGFMVRKDLPVAGSNEAIRIPKNNLELSLVLDNTGSMNDAISGGASKMSALKGAATSLIDDLQSGSASGSSVNIGIVPFTYTVKVRDANGDVPFNWLNNSLPFGSSWAGCMTEPRTGGQLSRPPALLNPSSRPFSAYYDTNVSRYSWYGRIMYRDFAQSGCTRTPTTFLTSDTSTLKSSINSMTPNGGTNIASGVLWGWRMLAPSWRNANTALGWGSPTLPQDSTAYLTKAMIIITDGVNDPPGYDTFNSPGTGQLTTYSGEIVSQSAQDVIGNYAANYQPYGPYYPHAYSGVDPRTTASLNSLTLAACNAAKAQGIKIWAIAFGNWSDVSASMPMLQSCVSEQAYFAPSNADLKKYFQSIAGQLSQLRLTK
ncbi:TadE/TadG family type IV pilus assembly protein [Paludibacterium purpuratum]|uniref:Putative Flp pilus-assembly TadE/G-like protein n=1 Tax=Paludibacterium purpuratum TaxID=1144873 RepID=A0A4R7B6G5_9NEIS|nr:TadE/TadG family type IV pilus assembly protein [Paludibacterium purpuratum]TDR80238.1 putative Flp pilus-assembly TadE/G-like protein [Paludibacterium purpuratum]